MKEALRKTGLVFSLILSFSANLCMTVLFANYGIDGVCRKYDVKILSELRHSGWFSRLFWLNEFSGIHPYLAGAVILLAAVLLTVSYGKELEKATKIFAWANALVPAAGLFLWVALAETTENYFIGLFILSALFIILPIVNTVLAVRDIRD